MRTMEETALSELRPKDCPPGLWAELSQLIVCPSEFIQDNPDVYEELKETWRRANKEPHPPGASPVAPDWEW